MVATKPAVTFLLLAACQGPMRNLAGPSMSAPMPAPMEARTEIAIGTILRLRPASIGAGEQRPPGYLVDGLWRTAMLQSVRFDIAAGVEACPCTDEIELHFEPPTRTLTSTLRRGSQAPVPLAAVRGEELGRGLDLLAWQTRAALGEDVANVEPLPVPCEAAYSADRNCVRFTELGLKEIPKGNFNAALRLFATARRYDPAAPVTLLHLAVTTANLPGTQHRAEASRIAKEGLEFSSRLPLATAHRLAKILLLGAGSGADAKLLELGQKYRQDRPHDPHGRFTVAHARCLLGHYELALPLLSGLSSRWPKNAPVRYQLAFARLATGDAEGALAALDEARRGLSRVALARPYAMALYHSDHHDELRRFLTDLRRRPGIAGSAAEREVIRMQASHALLVGQRTTAAKFIAEGFSWLRKHNSDLGRYALDLVEDGEVLARLGMARILADGIDGFLQLGQLPPAFANSLTYLGGLRSLLRQKTPTRALQTLEKSNDSVLYGQLEAAVFHYEGQLRAETAALRRVVSRSDDALAHANYARALAVAGKHEMSKRTSEYVHQRLLSFNQRRPHDHPLMTPGRAMAFLATRR